MNIPKKVAPLHKDDIFMPNAVRNRTDISWGEKFFLAEIITNDQKTQGKYYYNLKELSQHFFVTKPTMIKWVRDLMKAGLIDIISTVEGDEAVQRIIKPVMFRIFAN